MKDFTSWTRGCLDCQRSKASLHTHSPVLQIPVPDQRFQHVNIDLVGPLPPSEGYSYLLTCVERFTRWPEAIPITDITADTVARAFFKHWISRFGIPSVVTTYQGRQFQSALLSSLLGVNLIRTSLYHPASNGMVERFHRSLKQAIKCHRTLRWTEALPLVLRLRSAIKEDLGCTSSELVYGSTIRLPSEFLFTIQGHSH